MPDPVEPFDLAMAKARLRIVAADRDDEIKLLSKAARQHVEHLTEQVLTTPRAVTETFRAFTVAPMRLRTRPIVSIDRVDYLDPTGAAAFLNTAAVQLLNDPRGHFMHPAADTAWPSTYHLGARITATMTAGYPARGGEGADATWPAVPDDLVLAMLMLVRHFFDNPNAVVIGTIATELPIGVKALCAPHMHAY